MVKNSLYAPDGGYWVTISDGAGNSAMNVGTLGVSDGIGPDAFGTFTNATQTTSVTDSLVDGFSTVTISLNGTYGAASGIFEQSDDGGLTFYPILLTQEATGVAETGYTNLTNTNRMWRGSIAGADTFRIRSTAVASGTVNVSISPSAFPFTPVSSEVPYPTSAVPVTISATGTTGVTTATLPAAANKTTYISGFSISANATAAVTGNATITGPISGTMNFTQFVAPLASNIGVTQASFYPAIPASAVNTGIAVNSIAPGSGGTVSVTAWGYQL